LEEENALLGEGGEARLTGTDAPVPGTVTWLSESVATDIEVGTSSADSEYCDGAVGKKGGASTVDETAGVGDAGDVVDLTDGLTDSRVT
jgi:hypothetical protein